MKYKASQIKPYRGKVLIKRQTEPDQVGLIFVPKTAHKEPGAWAPFQGTVAGVCDEGYDRHEKLKKDYGRIPIRRKERVTHHYPDGVNVGDDIVATWGVTLELEDGPHELAWLGDCDLNMNGSSIEPLSVREPAPFGGRTHGRLSTRPDPKIDRQGT